VQGVGFRQATRKTAARLRLAGWVRNLPNGDVEVYSTDQMRQKCANYAKSRMGRCRRRMITCFEFFSNGLGDFRAELRCAFRQDFP